MVRNQSNVSFLADNDREKMRIIPICLTYLAGMLGAELTALGSSSGGLIFYMAILFSLVVHSAMIGNHSFHKLLLALSLGPLIRVIGIGMSLPELSEIYLYLVISIPAFAGIFSVIKILDLRPKDIGLTIGEAHVYVLVAVTGIGFGMVDYFILEPEPLISKLTWQGFIVPALILLISIGLLGELAFRGVMQHATQVIGHWGWVYIALMYSILQIGHESALHCLFSFEVALFFGWVVKRRGSILGVSFSHGLMSIGTYLIFPFVF